MTPDYNACGEKKITSSTFELVKASALVKPAFNDYRALMARACFALVGPFNARQGRVLRHALGEVSLPVLCIEDCVAVWDGFVAVLSTLDIDTTRLRKHQPVFDPTCNQGLFRNTGYL